MESGNIEFEGNKGIKVVGLDEATFRDRRGRKKLCEKAVDSQNLYR